MQVTNPEHAPIVAKSSRRKPNLEQIRRLRARPSAAGDLWNKPYQELSPEEIAELKRQFFASI